MKSKNILAIIAIIIVLALIGGLIMGYYKNFTTEVKNPIATMEVEGFGTVKIELYPRNGTKYSKKLYSII